MSTNSINNYIEPKTSVQTANTSVAVKSKKLLKPEQAHGHLVKSSLMDIPVDMFKNIAYDMKSLKHGISGDSNDHQLGKINDLGMKIGGLAVAAYLFTQKPTAKAKWMEFIGFGSFFGAIALWPKIALQAPARIIHGFDVQQKYEDSMGRKKSLFSDRQYLPFDLYSDKEINKIGDRLGVDRDVPNRREFIQEKMTKIAVQNNTMWMLTAGFATPIMSALACNEIEKHLGKKQGESKINKTENLIKNIEAEAEKLDFSAKETKFTELLSKNKDQIITTQILEDIAKAMIPTRHGIGKKLAKDLDNLLLPNKHAFLIDESVVEKILANAKKNVQAALTKQKSKYSELLDAAMPTKEATIQKLKDSGYLNTELNSSKVNRASFLISKSITDSAIVNLKMSEDNSYMLADYIFEAIERDAKSKCITVLNDDNIERIKNLHKLTQPREKEMEIISIYGHERFGNAPETVAANAWNDIMPSITKVFGFTPKELEKARFERVPNAKLLKSKIEIIASDPKKYAEAVKSIGSLITKLENVLIPAATENFCETTDKTFNKAAAEFMSLGLDETADELIGWKFNIGKIEQTLEHINDEGGRAKAEAIVNGEEFGLNAGELKNVLDRHNEAQKSKNAKDLEALYNEFPKIFNKNEVGSMKRIHKNIATQRLEGIKNTLYRTLNLFDLHRRVAVENFGPALNEKMKREGIEEILQTAFDVSMSGRAADHSIKFYTKRNPTPNQETGFPEVENGKIRYKYCGKEGELIDYKNYKHKIKRHGVDLPYDYNFYKNTMRTIYGANQDEVTKAALGERLSNQLSNYNKEILNKLGNAVALFKDSHTINDVKELTRKAGDECNVDAERTLRTYKANAEEKFILNGWTCDEMFTKIVNQKFNTNKWLKIFGTAAVALTGVTLISQFFFGNMPNPKKIKKDAK